MPLLRVPFSASWIRYTRISRICFPFLGPNSACKREKGSAQKSAQDQSFFLRHSLSLWPRLLQYQQLNFFFLPEHWTPCAHKTCSIRSTVCLCPLNGAPLYLWSRKPRAFGRQLHDVLVSPRSVRVTMAGALYGL